MATCISLNETLSLCWDYGNLAFLIVLVHLTFLYCYDRGDLISLNQTYHLSWDYGDPHFFKRNIITLLGLLTEG